MTTPPVVSITDELIAEIEEDAIAQLNLKPGQCAGGVLLQGDSCPKCGNGPQDRCGYPLSHRYADAYVALALLAERADLKRQLAAASVDAERWRYARDLLHPDDIRDFQDARDSFGMKPTEDISRQCDDAIDAARNIGSGD